MKKILTTMLLLQMAASSVVRAAEAGTANPLVWCGLDYSKVRMIGTMVIAGHHDPVAAALHHKLENLAGALLEADEQLARGKISATGHEMTWWRVYDQMGPASPVVHESGTGA